MTEHEQGSTRVEPPIWPVPSALERAMSEAVDHWRDEAWWWTRCACMGWSVAALLALGHVLRSVL